MNTFKELETVALLKNIPEHNMYRGDVGVIVSILSDDTVEVEFSNKDGKTVALIPVQTTHLIKLRMQPAAV